MSQVGFVIWKLNQAAGSTAQVEQGTRLLGPLNRGGLTWTLLKAERCNMGRARTSMRRVICRRYGWRKVELASKRMQIGYMKRDIGESKGGDIETLARDGKEIICAPEACKHVLHLMAYLRLFIDCHRLLRTIYL